MLGCSLVSKRVRLLCMLLYHYVHCFSTLDDVGLHHVIAALCKLSTEAMQVAQTQREPSYFPVAKLMQTGLSNLHRLTVFWKPVCAHLIEVCYKYRFLYRVHFFFF